MADACCQRKAEDLKDLARRQARVIWAVLLINLVMFGVELAAGLAGDSVALVGDSLDMLGDTLAYASTLFVLNMGVAAKARSAQFKGAIMVLLGIAVLGQAVYRVFFVEEPVAEIMGVVGGLALAANLVCLMLLTRHRKDDVNFSSVWVCSRNDIIANLSVIAAAAVVAWTGTRWPDLVVGAAIALLFTKSALGVFADSREALKAA